METREDKIKWLKDFYGYLTGECGMDYMNVSVEELVDIMSEKHFEKLVKKLKNPTFRYKNSWEYEEGIKVVWSDITEDYVENYEEYLSRHIVNERKRKLDILGV